MTDHDRALRYANKALRKSGYDGRNWFHRLLAMQWTLAAIFWTATTFFIGILWWVMQWAY